MATTLITGFEMQSIGEGFAVQGAPTISTSVFRSGAAALACITTATFAYIEFQKRPAGGTLVAFAQSFRFYLRIDVMVSANVAIAQNTQVGAAAATVLTLNSAGTLNIAGGSAAGTTSSLALTADAAWHRIDVDVSGTSRKVYVDGVLWASDTGVSAVAQTVFALGPESNTTSTLYFDDLLIDDGSIGAPASGANNKCALLIPTAGNNAGSWTDGAAGTGDIHGSVDNIPPVGAAAATAGAKIKNAASGTALDYVATMQTYLVGGLPPGSIVNAVQAISNDGEEATTGTKSGGVWIASNPAQSAVVIGTGVGFDYGDDVGLLATFPSNWSTHYGIVAVAPSVTLGTAPTVTIRKGSSTTRVVDVDFLGMYVDYTPPPIGKSLQLNQSVNRASLW